jgi:hypothetical protein
MFDNYEIHPAIIVVLILSLAVAATVAIVYLIKVPKCTTIGLKKYVYTDHNNTTKVHYEGPENGFLCTRFVISSLEETESEVDCELCKLILEYSRVELSHSRNTSDVFNKKK